ncbi:EamA family transporter [Falsiroseomonas bella]|nr:EamA family transporter [Falsiroseomonas bella]
MFAHLAQSAHRPGLAFSLPGDRALGLAAGLAAATIWGGALAMTRLGVAAEAAALGPHDIVLLRFLAPALLLLPVAWRALARLRRADLPRLALLLAGGGAPFVLLAGAGLREAAAADAGALLPGTMPLWVAAASLLAGRAGSATPAPAQRLGLGLMACSVLLVAGPPALGADGLAGPAMLVSASWLAAGYTLALRRSGLSAPEATALVSLGSVVGFLPYYLLACESGLVAATWGEVAVQAAWQGGLSGLLAPLAFALAVARLGAARAAALGALSPVSAAVFGFALMGEVPAPNVLIGLAAAAMGVVLAAGARQETTRRAR